MKFNDFIKRKNASGKINEYVIFCGYMVISFLISLFFYLLRIFPVKKNKVVFCNMKGKRYGDNPAYISEALLKSGEKADIVWLLYKDVKVDLPDGVRRVDYSLFNRMKELTTARVWVDSNTKDLGTRKRKNQLFIQTWHGSYGLKKIAFDLGDKFPLVDRVLYPHNAAIEDIMVSNSKRTTEIYRQAFRYSGKVLEVGSPRNDIFFEVADQCRKKVEKVFGIEGRKIVLYAPTWRKGYGTDRFNLDYEALINALNKRFSENYVVFLRLHPHNLVDAGKMEYSDRVLNASYYSNMQELLVAADVLVTDYSSCMFDFITVPKKCFLYTPDIDEYEKEQGNYYSLDELPFPVARNNGELGRIIETFDETRYNENIMKFHERVGLCESGEASKMVAEYIMGFIGK